MQISSAQNQSMVQQSNSIDEMKPTLQDLQQDPQQHPMTGVKGPSPQPGTGNDDGGGADMGGGQSELNGQNASGADPTGASIDSNSVKQENSAVQDSNPASLMTAM